MRSVRARTNDSLLNGALIGPGSIVGAGALVQSGRKPKIGIDVSTGIWDLDLYGELALRQGSEIDRLRGMPPLSINERSVINGGWHDTRFVRGGAGGLRHSRLELSAGRAAA